MNILLVDDNEALVNILGQYLQLRGHVVSVAFDGDEGLEALKHAADKCEPYDAMITDLVMPRMSGADMVDQAGAAGILPKAVLMMTGADPWYGRIPGVIEALEKPVDPEEIERKMAAHCRR